MNQEQVSLDLFAACNGDAAALERLQQRFGNAPRTVRDLREKMSAQGELTLDGVRLFVSRLFPDTRLYRIDRETIFPNPLIEDDEWDLLFDAMRDQGITRLIADERMTDAALLRLGERSDVVVEHLGISGWHGRLTDRGMAALRRLPRLRDIQLCWQQNITGLGAAHLRECEHLETVNLMGTNTGDETLDALGGKTYLRKLNTGRNVTDAGVAALHRIPAFQAWRGGDIRYSLMSPDAGPTHVMLDGPFTDAGLRRLEGLDGLFGLSFFWHCSEFTTAALAGLRELPNLGFLGCEGAKCDDGAMAHIAAIPRLRMLMGQGTVATDAGFRELSKSQTIEYIWGRECPNLGPEGFAALSTMPALKGLAVSCKNVDVSILPSFPALTELMPMDVQDDGFAHVGKCGNLEALWCMYCRESGDKATEHIAGLQKLKSYYAGASLITDRSLEILSRMDKLERLEFWKCEGITDAGVALLAGLPNLKEIEVHGSPGVTGAIESMFARTVRAAYSA